MVIIDPACTIEPQDKLTGDHSHTTGNVVGTGSAMDNTGAVRTTGPTAGTTHTHHESVGDKMKDHLHMGHHGTTATANERLAGGVPVTRSDSSSSSDSEGAKVVGAGQQYTAVEEHAVVKDKITTVREHHPVEKQYVTEVKEVGVRELPTRVEHLGTTERIVSGSGTGNTATGHHTTGHHTTGQHTGLMSGSTAHDTTTTHELK